MFMFNSIYEDYSVVCRKKHAGIGNKAVSRKQAVTAVEKRRRTKLSI
jgi:hypothetical protein